MKMNVFIFKQINGNVGIFIVYFDSLTKIRFEQTNFFGKTNSGFLGSGFGVASEVNQILIGYF